MHLYECSMLFLYDEDPDVDRLEEIKNDVQSSSKAAYEKRRLTKGK